jgi:hypothetical protein
MSSRILVDPNLAAAKQLLEYVDAVPTRSRRAGA